MRHLVGGDLVEDSGDFRAISRRALEAARGFREPHRFLRFMFASLGFRQAISRYDRHARFAGKTKYPLGKMVRLAINAVLSYSTVPIRGILWLAVLAWRVSLVYLARRSTRGWCSASPWSAGPRWSCCSLSTAA